MYRCYPPGVSIPRGFVSVSTSCLSSPAASRDIAEIARRSYDLRIGVLRVHADHVVAIQSYLSKRLTSWLNLRDRCVDD
jgi:hypothetical protein